MCLNLPTELVASEEHSKCYEADRIINPKHTNCMNSFSDEKL